MGLEAEKAWQALITGLDLKDVIVKCYRQMSLALEKEQGIERKDFMTTREFENLLEAAGIPHDPIHQLTQLFEAVRYGNWQPQSSWMNRKQSTVWKPSCCTAVRRRRRVEMKFSRRMVISILFVMLILLVGMLFWPFILNEIIKPIALVVWLLLRIFVLSIDQKYYWGAIIFVVVVFLFRLLSQDTNTVPSGDFPDANETIENHRVLAQPVYL